MGMRSAHQSLVLATVHATVLATMGRHPAGLVHGHPVERRPRRSTSTATVRGPLDDPAVRCDRADWATTGALSRHQRAASSCVQVPMPVSGSSAEMISAAVLGRAAGSLARHWSTNRSSAAGIE